MPNVVSLADYNIKPLRLGFGLIACIGLVVVFFTLLFGFTSIPANSIGVKTRFGAYDALLQPGLAYAIPHVDEIHIVPTQRLLKLEFGFSTSNSSTLNRLAELCSQYGLGIQIQQVQLATVRPPPVVQAAFNDVNQAQQEKQTAINQAWAVYNDAVPNARGQAKEREKQAEAYAFRRVNEAKGDAEKFSLLMAEYRKAPDVMRHRLYFEAMQALLPSLQKKVIVDDSLKGILQTLPLLPAEPPKSAH
jgi:regulator of protease activity HflC (stomatin/prohibitin superfamily)